MPAPRSRRSRRPRRAGLDTGIRVKHPAMPKAGTLPVYVANFVLMDYGTGAIFGCPAHDQRDLDFARKYDLPVVPVVLPKRRRRHLRHRRRSLCRRRRCSIRTSSTASACPKRRSVAAPVGAHTLGNAPQGERKVNYRLRDWGISRQRYWGCPIPVIHCETCGVVPVPKADLPVKLPDDVTFDKPGNPLDRHPTWKHVACPQCGKARPPRDGHDGHLRRFVLVLRPLHRARGPNPDGAGRRQCLAAGRPVYRRHRARDPASALFALLHPRHAG
jgi:leucyl-tRNA synthetase